jgi:signal transduction histidine kinase
MRRLLLAGFLGIVLIALAVSTLPFAIFIQGVERDRLLTGLERDAFVLAGRAEEALESLTPSDLGPVRELASEYREAGGARVVIVDRAGVAVVTNDPEEVRVGISYANRPEFMTALAGAVATGERFSDTLNVTLVYVAVPVFSGDRVLGAVRLTFDKAAIDREVTRQLSGVGLVALTTLLLGAILALILSRSLARGLKELDEAASAISRGELTARAREDVGPSDIRALAQAFNTMATRVGLLVEEQKRFASDASHQLRTPLTAIMLRLEGLRASLASTPKTDERFDAIEAEVARLNRLIDGLLALGRSGADGDAIEVVDASTICVERVASWRNLAEEAGKNLSAEIEPGLAVWAAPTAVEQILDVFLDNALALEPREGNVLVTLQRSDNAIILSVQDHGPGLSPEQEKRAFDRFWRGPNDYQGTGLGLAIAQQLASRSDATLTLTNRPGGGAVAQATFRATHP